MKASTLDPDIKGCERSDGENSERRHIPSPATADRRSYLLRDYLLGRCGEIDGEHMVPARDMAPLVGGRGGSKKARKKRQFLFNTELQEASHSPSV